MKKPFDIRELARIVNAVTHGTSASAPSAGVAPSGRNPKGLA